MNIEPTRNTADEGSTILKEAIKRPRPDKLFPSAENKRPNLSRDYFSMMVPNKVFPRGLPQTPLSACPLLSGCEIR